MGSRSIHLCLEIITQICVIMQKLVVEIISQQFRFVSPQPDRALSLHTTSRAINQPISSHSHDLTFFLSFPSPPPPVPASPPTPPRQANTRPYGALERPYRRPSPPTAAPPPLPPPRPEPARRDPTAPRPRIQTPYEPRNPARRCLRRWRARSRGGARGREFDWEERKGKGKADPVTSIRPGRPRSRPRRSRGGRAKA